MDGSVRVYGTVLNLVSCVNHMIVAGNEYGLHKENGRLMKLDRFVPMDSIRCVIRFEDTRFKLCENVRLDNAPCPTTSKPVDVKLNGKVLLPFQCEVLRDNAFIAFGNPKMKLKFFYKFNVHTYARNEAPNEDEGAIEQLRSEEMYETSKKINSEALKMQNLIGDENQIVPFPTVNWYKIDTTYLKNIFIKLLEQKSRTELLIADLEAYVIKNYVPVAVRPTFKTKLFKILLNHLQCFFCKEIVIKASVAVCGHLFCKGCLSKWLLLHDYCPVCNRIIKKSMQCFPLTGFINDLFSIYGGSVKEHRVAMLQGIEEDNTIG